MMFCVSCVLLWWGIFASASLFKTGTDPSLYTSRYYMKYSSETNKQQMQLQIKVLPRHFEGK